MTSDLSWSLFLSLYHHWFYFHVNMILWFVIKTGNKRSKLINISQNEYIINVNWNSNTNTLFKFYLINIHIISWFQDINSPGPINCLWDVRFLLSVLNTKKNKTLEQICTLTIESKENAHIHNCFHWFPWAYCFV